MSCLARSLSSSGFCRARREAASSTWWRHGGSREPRRPGRRPARTDASARPAAEIPSEYGRLHGPTLARVGGPVHLCGGPAAGFSRADATLTLPPNLHPKRLLLTPLAAMAALSSFVGGMRVGNSVPGESP